MGMTQSEKDKVLEYLDKLDDGERKRVLSSFEKFTNWMKNALSYIYNKVKDFISDLFYALGNLFS